MTPSQNSHSSNRDSSLQRTHSEFVAGVIVLFVAIGTFACYWLISANTSALFPGLVLATVVTFVLGTIYFFRVQALKKIESIRSGYEQKIVEMKEEVSRSSANENNFRKISESIPVGVFQLNENGFCEYTNNKWRTLCINSNMLEVEHRWVDILCEETRENAFNDWQNASHDCLNFQGVYRQKTKAGEVRWLEVAISPVFSDEGALFVGTAEDITAKKISHDKLRQTADALRLSKEAQELHAARLEQVVKELEVAKVKAEQSAQAKSEFLANMSHEIRTPISAILGYTDVVLDDTASDSHAGESLRTIKRNGEHLLQIINDILDISKIEAGKMEVELVSCSPKQVVEESIELLSGRAKEKSLTLSSEYEGHIPEFIKTDPTRLRQILLNLLSNAIKFTKTGSVRVITKFQKGSGCQDQPQLEIRVVDTGIGMTQQQVDKLFQPFTQADSSTSRQFGGTGLGLSISQRLAGKLGGEISIQSEAKKGSTFIATVSTGDLSGVAMLNHAKPAISLQGKKQFNSSNSFHAISLGDKTSSHALDCNLLLVEDGEDNQRLISFLMKKAGAQVTIAENGLIGVEKTTDAIEQGKPFDLILMDMQMPVMDGYTATAEIRDRNIAIPIIALTAHAMAGDRKKCLQAGCNDYATKPIDRNKLITKINQLLKATPTSFC